MGNDRLQKILDSYAEKYSAMCDADTNEVNKWTAASTFHMCWDIEADDFGAMCKAALAGWEGQLWDASFQPVSGVLFLCAKGPEAAAAVREEFRALLAADGGDLAERQRRAEAFVDGMNEILRETDPSRWKYHQDMSSALLYLTLADPEDNYLYEETSAKLFAEYMGQAALFEEGERVQIPAYYRLCDALNAELQQQSDLLQAVDLHLAALAEKSGDGAVTEVDTDRHLLSFDVLWAARAHELYDTSLVPSLKRKRHKKVTAADAARAKEGQMLHQQLRGVEAKLAREVERLKGLALPDMVGAAVTHSRFGEGRVTAQEGNRMAVQFAACEKKFVLPDCFSKGFLTADPAIVETCRAYCAQANLVHRLQVDAHLLDLQVNGLAKED